MHTKMQVNLHPKKSARTAWVRDKVKGGLLGWYEARKPGIGGNKMDRQEREQRGPAACPAEIMRQFVELRGIV